MQSRFSFGQKLPVVSKSKPVSVPLSQTLQMPLRNPPPPIADLLVNRSTYVDADDVLRPDVIGQNGG
jgi:hypothetical protein